LQAPSEQEPRARQREVTTLTTRSSRIGAIALALVITFSSTPSAFADRISDRKAEARQVQAQIEALDNKVEMAAESYNLAADRYAKLTRQVRRTNVKLAGIRKHMTTLQGALNNRADHMYRSGPLGFLEVLLEAKSFEDFSTTWDVLKDVSAQDADTVSQLKSARKESEAALHVLKVAQTNAATQKKAMAANQQRVYAQLAERKTKLAAVNGDIRSLIAAEQAAEEARADERARAASPRHARIYDVGGNPPSNASRGERVVYYAMSQRGKPYRWGADGPSSYDCSGLTMWAYGRVGVGLPHNASAGVRGWSNRNSGG
jgi:peptidoglycan hydrolase CwlO-like protein